MSEFTLHALSCFDAVASEGGFQAAAEKLHRTHPAIHAAIRNLEAQLGFALFDRTGYRIRLTEPGRAFHERTKSFLAEAKALQHHARQISRGEESEIRIVLGDLCQTERFLPFLRRFFQRFPRTRMHLHFEAISGPWERLLAHEADVIFHHIDKSDQRLEYIDLHTVSIIPVVAPGFLPFAITRALTPARMRSYTQCVIRDTAKGADVRSYYLVEGAHTHTVADQFTKKQMIMMAMAWGHMPHYMVDKELRSGKLLALSGQHFKGGKLEIVAARLRRGPQGPVATELWSFIAGEMANSFTSKQAR